MYSIAFSCCIAHVAIFLNCSSVRFGNCCRITDTLLKVWSDEVFAVRHSLLWFMDQFHQIFICQGTRLSFAVLVLVLVL